MPKYYECIRGYLYNRSYMGRVSTGEGIYTVTKNVIDDSLPSLFEKTTLLGANRAERVLGEDVKIFLYEPSVDMNGVKMRAFHCAHSRQSIKRISGRRGNDEEQINVLFATEIPNGKHATAAFKSSNRFVEYGDIPIDENLPFVQEDEAELLSPSDVKWHAEAEAVSKDTVELLRALFNAKESKSTFLAYTFDSYERATSVIFSAIESLPAHIANEICFCNCMISRISSDGVKLFAVPIEDKSVVTDLKAKGEVLVLGEKYENDVACAYADLVEHGDLDGFSSRYFAKCKTLDDLNAYAELYVYQTARITPERAQDTLDFLSRFAKSEQGKRMDSRVKDDIFELLLSCIDVLTGAKISLSENGINTVGTLVGSLPLSASEREDIARALCTNMCLGSAASLIENAENLNSLIDPDNVAVYKALGSMWQRDEQMLTEAYERAFDKAEGGELALVIMPSLSLAKKLSPASSDKLTSLMLKLTFKRDAKIFLSSYDFFEQYATEIIKLLSSEWEDKYKAKMDSALCSINAIEPCFKMYKLLASSNKTNTPLAIYLLNSFVDHVSPSEVISLFYSGKDVESGIDACLGIISTLSDSHKGSSVAAALVSTVKKEVYDKKITAFKVFYKRIKNPIAKYAFDALVPEIASIIKENQQRWHSNQYGKALTDSPLKLAIRAIERENSPHLAKLRDTLVSYIPDSVRREMSVWESKTRSSIEGSPLHTELLDAFQKRSEDKYEDVYLTLVNDLRESLLRAQRVWSEDAPHGSFINSPEIVAINKMVKYRTDECIKELYDEVINDFVYSVKSTLPEITDAVITLENHVLNLSSEEAKKIRGFVKNTILVGVSVADAGIYEDTSELEKTLSELEKFSVAEYTDLVARLKSQREENLRRDKKGCLSSVAKRRLFSCIDRCSREMLIKILKTIKQDEDSDISLYDKDNVILKSRCGETIDTLSDKMFAKYVKYRLSGSREYKSDFAILGVFRLTDEKYGEIEEELLSYIEKPTFNERVKVASAKIGGFFVSVLLFLAVSLITRAVWSGIFNGFGMMMFNISVVIGLLTNTSLQISNIFLNTYRLSMVKRAILGAVITVLCAIISVLIPIIILLCA